MKEPQARTVLDGLVFPEGIRWHAGLIWFSDILDFKVWTYDPRTGTGVVFAELPVRPSGLGFTPAGDLLVAAWERELIRLGPDGPQTVARLDTFGAQLNDMVVDRGGRAYIDYYAGDPIKDTFAGTRKGGLLAVEPDGTARIVDDAMTAPNGMAITPDGKALLVNDHGRIWKYDIRPDGDLANRREFAPLAGDGLCLDAEGAVWIGASSGGSPAFTRVVEGGDVTHRVRVAGENIHTIAPVLGGPDRRTLYGTVSRWRLADLLDAIGDIVVPRRAPGLRDRVKGWIVMAEGIEAPGAGIP